MSESVRHTAETYELMVCGWDKNPRHCVYLNDTRIAGGKPWGGAHEVRAWNVTLDDLAGAIPAIRLMREALQYGFDLYGNKGPDGPWPVERRREFDRLASEALNATGGRDNG